MNVMGQWETNKQIRRTRITAAAEELIETGGVDAINMQALAKTADVSVATLYNLVGSKSDILYALLSERLEDIHDLFLQPVQSNPVDHLAWIASSAAEVFLHKRRLFHPLMNAISREADPLRDPPLAIQVGRPFEQFIERTAVDGWFADDADARSVSARQVYLNITLAVRQWARDALSDRALPAAYVYAAMSMILPIATVRSRPLIMDQLTKVTPTLAKSAERLNHGTPRDRTVLAGT